MYFLIDDAHSLTSLQTQTTEKDRDANMGYARLLKEMAAYFEQTTDFVVPSNNPYAAFKAMQEKLDAIGDKINVTIVPMNNKLSTLGVALIGLANPEIQIDLIGKPV